MTHSLNPSFVQSIIKKHGFNIKKRLGQNFLIDGNVAGQIVEGAQLSEADWVLEIGPGLGALTGLLAERARKVVALELDGGLVRILEEMFSVPAVQIVAGDALALDWEQALIQAGWGGQPLKIVANLPYYLTSPLIMKALEQGLPFELIIVMVQKEVAERILAQPGSKDYGVLSLAVQYYSEGTLLFNVPRTVFLPRPNVDSAVIALRPKEPQTKAPRRQLFQAIRASFQQRRKTVRNALKPLAQAWGLKPEDLDRALLQAGVDRGLRGERLSLRDFDALTLELIKEVQADGICEPH